MSEMVKVAVDAMGGDNAPSEILKGAVLAVEEDSRIKVFKKYFEDARVHAQSFSHFQLCDPMDCSSLGSSAHGISQARILKWVVISSPILRTEV